jgi:5S rRNA maturation endonuclease (ribonuclease M5)
MITDKIENLLTKLQKVKSTGKDKWIACCPAHADNDPSLSIGLKGNKILLNCFSGCSIEQILAGIELDMSDLFADSGKIERQIIATYDYQDEAGNPIFQKVRYKPKDFLCRIPDGSGWKYKLNGCRKVLYNLPAVIKSETVYIAEGEKDCDTLKRLGYVSTCNYDGASKDTQKPKWSTDYNPFFKDKVVFIIPDNDSPGIAHAKNIYKNIKGLAASVKLVKLPDKFKDTTEFFEGGGNKEQFDSLCRDATDTIPESGLTFGVSRLSCVLEQTIQWLWYNRIPLGMLSLIVGDPDAGKSFLTCYTAATVSTGRDWPDGEKCEKGSVLIFNDEDPDFVIKARIVNAGGDESRIYIVKRLSDGSILDINNPEHLAALEKLILSLDNCRLLIFDPITAYIGNINQNANNEVRAALIPLVDMAQRLNITILGINHLSKKADLEMKHRTLGSIGFNAAARSVWGVTQDKGDDTGETRLFQKIKANLSVKVKGLSYSIQDGRIVWDSEPVEESIDESMRESPAMDAAIDFLNEILSPAGKLVEQSHIVELAKERNLKERTLARAKKKIGIKSVPQVFEDGKKQWFWRLDND